MLAAALKVAVAPTVTVWALPALATGTLLLDSTVMVVATGSEKSLPSFTIRLATYTPALSGVKLAFEAVAVANTTVLVSGLDISVQL